MFILGQGVVAKGVHSVGPFGLVTLTKMKNQRKIGKSVSSDETYGPTTNILFYDVKAIKALISELEDVAKKIAKFEKRVVHAANYNPVGRADLRRKIPRKREKR